jgi:gliding motility-associated protein GldC
MTTKKHSKINLNVELGADRIPEKITWESTDNPQNEGPLECKAFLLSLFDKEHKDTFRIDLWTKEMQVSEMDRFVYFTLKGIAETYHRATQNTDLSNHLAKFTEFFGEESGILPKEE